MTELETKLTRLADLKAAEAKLAPIKQEIEQLRIDIQYLMQEAHSKRTEPVAGYFAVREERKSLQVVDEDILLEWLDENVMDPGAYLKPDPIALKALAAETLDATGELIPGLETVSTETISIRKSK